MPLCFLASLVGTQSEEFDRIEFEPGLAVLTPPEREKLHSLSEALTLRPQLGLDVPGVVAVEADRAALKKIQVEARMNVILAEQSGLDVQGIRLRERRKAILETLFGERYPDTPLSAVQQQFMKPVDPQQAQGRLALDEIAYVAELRRQLVATELVTDQALEQLAMARAKAVSTVLTDEEGIAPARISTSLGKTVKMGKSSWVSLKLKLENR